MAITGEATVADYKGLMASADAGIPFSLPLGEGMTLENRPDAPLSVIDLGNRGPQLLAQIVWKSQFTHSGSRHGDVPYYTSERMPVLVEARPKDPGLIRRTLARVGITGSRGQSPRVALHFIEDRYDTDPSNAQSLEARPSRPQ